MKLVADSNVLLSAIAGGRAKLVLEHPAIEEMLAPTTVYEEVREYLGEFARRRRLAADVLLMSLATLPVTFVDRDIDKECPPEAFHRIGQRDPDDVDTLALALLFSYPIWSNDKDFEHAGVDVYPTARLLRHLGVRKG